MRTENIFSLSTFCPTPFLILVTREYPTLAVAYSTSTVYRNKDDAKDLKREKTMLIGAFRKGKINE